MMSIENKSAASEEGANSQEYETMMSTDYNMAENAAYSASTATEPVSSQPIVTDYNMVENAVTSAAVNGQQVTPGPSATTDYNMVENSAYSMSTVPKTQLTASGTGAKTAEPNTVDDTDTLANSQQAEYEVPEVAKL